MNSCFSRAFGSTVAFLLAATAAFGQPSSTGPLAPPANGPRRADPAWFAIHDCVVHIRPGQVVEHATVVCRDGVIVAVLLGEAGPDGKTGTEDDVAGRTPLGPRVIPGAGLHVYSGFIDPYVEIDVPAPAADTNGRHWNARVTPQRTALDGGGIDEGTAAGLRKLGFAAACISPRGGVFRGQSALVSLAKPAADASVARPAVYRNRVYQSVAFEGGGGGYPGSQMGAIALVRQCLSDAAWQHDERVSGRMTGGADAVDALVAVGAPGKPGGGGREADGLVDRAGTLVFDCRDELMELRAIRVAKEFGRTFMVLGSGLEYQRLGEIAKTEHLPLFLPVNFPKAPEVGTVGKQEATELTDLMAWEQAPTNPRRVQAAGVKFAFTTARLRERDEFRGNVRLAILAGLSEDDALAALTTRPAGLLAMAERMGTVEVGKVANLLVTDGPVFEKKTKYRSVFVDGVEHVLFAPPAEADGEWLVTIPGAPEAKRRLEITKENGVTVHRNDKSVKGDKVTLESGVLSFTFDHEGLDETKGIYAMSAAVVTDHNGKAMRLVGEGVRPDGERFDWSATRMPEGSLSSMTGVWDYRLMGAEAGGFARPGTIEVLKADNDKGERVLVRTLGDDQLVTTAVATNVTGEADVLEYEVAGGEAEPATKVRMVMDRKATPVSVKGEARTGETVVAFEGVKRRGETSSPVGKWRVVEADGELKAMDGDGLEMVVTSKAVTLTFSKAGDGAGAEPTIIKGDKVAIEKGVLTFEHALEAIGVEGVSKDRVVVEGDLLVGVSTLPDDSKHVYKAVRTPAPKEEETADEAWRLVGVPDALPMPFGPYGLREDVYAAEAGYTLIENATIWTGNEVIEKGTLLAHKGKIIFVGTGATPMFDDETVKIDAAGKVLTAGIIDAHSHTGISGGVNEGGQAVTAEVRIADVTNPDTVDWYRQLASGVTGMLALHGSANAIGGQSQTCKMRWGVSDPDAMHFEGSIPGIKFALGENPTGKNGSGDNGGQYPISRMGVEMLIRDRFTAAKEYAREPMGARRDLELEALAEILAGTRLIHCHAYRQDEIVMLCHVAKDFGFKIGTFQHVLEGYKVADYVRDYSGGGSGFSDWWAFKVEVQDAIPAGLPIMHEAGAVVSFNSDSNELARRLNVEAAKGVKYGGLSDLDAWRFVTLNPAKQLRIDNRVGTLEVGKDADMALWSGDPLSAFSKCEATWVDGRRLFSLEQDAEHRAWITAERQRLIQKVLVGAEKKKDSDKDGEKGEADGEKPADGGGPGGPPGEGRRRRQPSEGESDAAWALRRHMLAKAAGLSAHRPGVCGCEELSEDQLMDMAERSMEGSR